MTQTRVELTVLVQARLGSSRLPGKVFRLINGQPLLIRVLRAIDRSLRNVSIQYSCVLAVPESETEDFRQFLDVNGITAWALFGGSEDDVLSRFHAAADQYPSELIARVTADNPFVRGDLILEGVNRWITAGQPTDFYFLPTAYAHGASIEVFSHQLLDQWNAAVKDPALREHVTLAHREKTLQSDFLRAVPPRERLSLTVDSIRELRRAELLAVRMEPPLERPSTAEWLASALEPAWIFQLDDLPTPPDLPRPLVMAGGCFDLLHAGHALLIHRAAALGASLVVAINNDESVSQLKGQDRPVVNQTNRSQLLAMMRGVDGVVIFKEATPEKALRFFKPEFFVKGESYRAETLPEEDVMAEWGGHLAYVHELEGLSTSAIAQKIRSQSESSS